MEEYNLLDKAIENIEEAYDELDGSKKYIKQAIRSKSTDRAMADRLVTMSTEELGHADSIAEGVEAMLTKAEKDGMSCAPMMRKVWAVLRERMADYKAWILKMHDEYKTVM